MAASNDDIYNFPCLFISFFHRHDYFLPAYICRIVRILAKTQASTFVWLRGWQAGRFRALGNSIGCPYLVLWQMLYVIMVPSWHWSALLFSDFVCKKISKMSHINNALHGGTQDTKYVLCLN